MRAASIAGALLLTLTPRLAPGQAQESSQNLPSNSVAEAAEPALWVEVAPGPALLEPDATRQAIEQELGLTVVNTAERFHVGKVTVHGLAGPAVSVRYESKDGTTVLERRVALPVDFARRSQVVAWVVGNLVRNEAAEILSGMTRASEALEAAPLDGDDGAFGGESRDAAAIEPPVTELAAPTKQVAPAKPVGAETSSVPPESPMSKSVAADLGPTQVLHWALYSPRIELPRDAREHRYRLSFGGAYSHVGALRGFGLSLFVGQVERDILGAQISGLWLQSSDTRGGTVAGLGAISRGDLLGVEVAGLVAARTGCIVGAQVGGLWASAGATCATLQVGNRPMNRRMLSGVQVGGLVGHFSGRFRGVQLSGIAAIAGDRSEGLQMTGGVALARSGFVGAQVGFTGNVAQGHSQGLQLSALFNVQRGQFNGVQLSTGFNYADEVRGVQFGTVNVGRRIRGVQLGFVNVASEEGGLGLGLVNWTKDSRFQPTYFFETPRLHNIGFRILSRYLASAISFGYDVPHDIARTHFALGPHAALGRVGVGLEFGYGWVLDRLASARTDRAHELDLTGTMTLEIIRNALALYGGGGVAMPVAGVVPIEPRGVARAGISVF